MIYKLPGWCRYSGEKHMRGYNYCGPGTRLDVKLDKQDKRNRGDEPINDIYGACFRHDLSYRDNDLKQKHIADVKLIHALNYIKDLKLKERFVRWIIKSAMKGKLLLGGQV